MSEIDALTEKSSVLQDYWNRAQRDLAGQQDELAALKAEVERLRRDAERLDMLGRPGISLRTNDDQEDPIQYAIFQETGYPNDREWAELGHGKSVRDAIDASMKEPK